MLFFFTDRLTAQKPLMKNPPFKESTDCRLRERSLFTAGGGANGGGGKTFSASKLRGQNFSAQTFEGSSEAIRKYP